MLDFEIQNFCFACFYIDLYENNQNGGLWVTRAVGHQGISSGASGRRLGRSQIWAGNWRACTKEVLHCEEFGVLESSQND